MPHDVITSCEVGGRADAGQYVSHGQCLWVCWVGLSGTERQPRSPQDSGSSFQKAVRLV